MFSQLSSPDRKGHRVGSIGSHFGAGRIDQRWENWWPRLLLAQLLCRRWPSQNVAVVVLFNGFDNRVAMEAATFCLDGRDKTPEIFERMKRTLARIAQYVLLLAMGEGNADQPMDGRADEAN